MYKRVLVYILKKLRRVSVGVEKIRGVYLVLQNLRSSYWNLF